MIDKTPQPKGISPVLSADWSNSRWGPEDQRGNGNLMTAQKVLEAVSLIKTGEIVSLGMPYDSRMPIAPGRAYALRMPGGPTGGPYGSKSRTIWNDEFIATEIGQIGTQMDALGHLGCMCGARGDKTNMLFYNGNRLSEMWSPYGLKKLGMENAPPFFTRGVLFDVQGLKGRVLDVGEEIRLSDLKACLERQGVVEDLIGLAMRYSCAQAMDPDGIRRRKPSTTAHPASASNPHVGFRISKFASSARTILPLRWSRRSMLRSFTPATSISSWRTAFTSMRA